MPLLVKNETEALLVLLYTSDFSKWRPKTG